MGDGGRAAHDPGRVLAVIPSRLESQRLPRKALLRETGRYLFQHVCERVALARNIDRVLLATDSAIILDAAREVGIEAVLTSADHPSGTDRVIEVARREPRAEIILNVQGDEPEIDPGTLETLVDVLERKAYGVATLAAPLAQEEELDEPSIVKVVCDARRRALYFSRSAIPHQRDERAGAWRAARRHVGVYAFHREALLRFGELPRGELERIESLEQLRLLEHGIEIGVVEIPRAPRGIDTPEDYAAFVRDWRSRGPCGEDRSRDNSEQGNHLGAREPTDSD